jgi:hypothetical protein
MARLQKDFQIPNRLTFGAEYFYKLNTNDHWIVSDFENSLASLFLHEDFIIKKQMSRLRYVHPSCTAPTQ